MLESERPARCFIIFAVRGIRRVLESTVFTIVPSDIELRYELVSARKAIFDLLAIRR